MGEFLTGDGIATEAELEAVREEVDAEIARGLEKAEAAPKARIQDFEALVYA